MTWKRVKCKWVLTTYQPVGIVFSMLQTTVPNSKTRLLDAALRVIRAKGYNATTVDDICAEAKLTKGGFFHHFKSKEHLALDAAAHFSAMADGLFSQAPYHQADDPLQRFLGYIDFRGVLLQGELPDVTCLLGTMVQETYQSHPAIRDACSAYISLHAEMVARDIAQAKELYAPNAPWSAISLAHYTQAVLQGAFILAKAESDPSVAADCLTHLRRYAEDQFRPKRKTRTS